MRIILSREAFFDRLQGCLEACAADGSSTGLVVFRIETIRRLRGTLGPREVGSIIDEVLARISAADRLLRSGRPAYDLDIGRLGSDELGIAVCGRVTGRSLQRLAGRILDLFSQPVTIAGHVVGLDISMGVAQAQAPFDVEDLVRRAQIAVEDARGKGARSVSYFLEDMAAKADRRLQMETLLRAALERGDGLFLLYQPQISALSGRIEAVEALVRWDHPAMGIMLPGQFISLAEERGLGLAICDWVMQRACRQLRAWHLAGLTHIGLSVNLSSDSLEIERVAALLRVTLQETRIDPTYLELEITERFAMDDPERSVAACARLRDLGVTLALDDFGTGYSSFTHLQHLPVSRLKIDKSFVNGLPENTQNLALVKGIIGLAHALGLKVVAEGVETAAQRDCLQGLGCDSYQGYFFAEPMSAADFQGLIEEQGRPPS